MDIIFYVPGIPRPGGSKRGFVIPGTKRVVITEDCKRSKDWRTSVAWAAKEKMAEPLRGPLEVRFTFFLARPKNHYGTGKNIANLKKAAPAYPAVKPDTTKLVRSTEDALKGIAWLDDSQVVCQHASKAYGIPGAEIMICELNAHPAERAVNTAIQPREYPVTEERLLFR